MYFKITKTTTSQELKAQFRKAVMKTHPDKGGSKEQFTEMQKEFALTKSQVDDNTSWVFSDAEFEAECAILNAELDDLFRTDGIIVTPDGVYWA